MQQQHLQQQRLFLGSAKPIYDRVSMSGRRLVCCETISSVRVVVWKISRLIRLEAAASSRVFLAKPGATEHRDVVLGAK